MPKRNTRGGKRDDGAGSRGRHVDSDYSVGEKVLAYYGPRIYEAKVQRVGIQKNNWSYFVSPLDQRECWDEWVGTDRLMKYTEENIVKQQALVKEQGVDKNPESGSSTQISMDRMSDEVLNDEKIKKEDVKSSGAEGKNRESDSSTEEDFISQMSNEVLVKILSLLPIKHAVATGILSTRWMTVWYDLKKLDFDGTETLDKMDEKLRDLERAKYINQVENVIRSHSNPKVYYFRICFDLDKTHFKDVDNWLRFALDKKVELLELNLCEYDAPRDTKDNYDFPLPLSDGNMVHLSEWQSSSSVDVKTLSLKKLLLLRVNVNELTLNELLKNSPQLEMLYIYGSGLLTDINFGGRDIKLKHFILMDCAEVQSISLYDFDLEKFHFIGREIEIHLMNLPKIKEVDIGRVSVGLNSKVFNAISSVASYLEVLSLDIDRTQEDLNVEAIPKLSNVKTLKLTLPTQHDDNLLEFIEIAKACPVLETLIISLHWCSPNTRKKKWYDVVGHSFPHLKRLEIGGYCGRVSDFQIAIYMIGNIARSLTKIVIDPSCHPYDKYVLTAEKSLEREDVGRSHAKSDLSLCVPQWVELVIL